MKKYFVKKNVDILAHFQSAVNSKMTKISSQTFRRAFKEIGLEFDYSLIEDIKSKIIADQLVGVDVIGNKILNCLVALFTDHLLTKRIERSRSTNKAFDMCFSEVFSKSEMAHQYLTKRQYKTSITYMYSNLPKRTETDPFLVLSNRKDGAAAKVCIKKSDCIKFLISREPVVEQISSEMREVSSVNVLTANEQDFVRIYNRCLSFLIELSSEDVSLFTNKEAIVLSGMQ